MAKGFNLTAQINLRGPTNLKPIVADIRRQLGSISANVDVKLNPQVAKSISTVTSRLKSMNDILVTARGNADALGSSLSDLSNSLSTISNSGSKSATSISKTGVSAKAAAQNIKQASTAMEEFGKQSYLAIKRFAAFSVVSGAIYKLVNAINTGFSAFVNFDKQLVKLQQVTGKGAIGLKNLENQITSLATSLGVSSESLIEVASTLAQAGLNAEDTRIALSALAKTELAPSFDNITDTTEGAIAALRQFELQAGDLEAALGSINAVAAAFAVESRDIITAIQRTGGVFAAASKGVSEGKDALNEFIAVFTSVRATTRESAETIATGLRTIFTRIQRGKTIEALKEYGVVLTDLEGKFVGPYEAVKRLSEGLKLLDPRDLRFSQIVEELGGFRQIGKVIPLIQQFSEAQKALRVAQTGQSSLTDAQVIAQKSLANQIAKVREQFLALIRDVGKSATFQAITKIVLNLTSAFISLASAFKPILPFLAILGTIKSFKALGEFGTGFFGGFKGGGSAAKNIGSNIGSTLSGTKEKEKSAVTKLATDAINNNTSALKSLTVAIGSLQNTIKSKSVSTLNNGGKIMGFARGGMVPGSGNRDTVPAVLTPGEFVIRKKAVETIGADNLQKMNKYALGGRVSLFGRQISNTYSSLKNRTQPDQQYSAQIQPIPESTNSIKPRMQKLKELYPGYPNWKLFEYAVAQKRGLKLAGGNKFLDYPNVLGEAKFLPPNATYAQDQETGFLKGNNNETMLAKLIGSGEYKKNATVRTYYPQKISDFRNFAIGGMVQKFMAGEIVKPVRDQLSGEELYAMAQELGQPQTVTGLVGGTPVIEQALRKVVTNKPAKSSEIFKKNFLTSDRSTPYLSIIQDLLEIADSNKSKPRVFTAEEKAAATKLGLVGMVPFGINDTHYEDIAGRIVRIHTATLPKDKIPAILQMKKEIDQVLGRTTQSLFGTTGKDLDDPTKEALGLGNLEGYMIEAILAKAGANPGKLDDRSVDYASGLGSAASLFGIEPNIPTEIKRDVKGGLSKARANFRNYFAKFAFGGKADGASFDEIKQKIIDKYPKIDFRISKRKGGRGFGYNLLGALKADGGLLKSKGLQFEQASNLEQLIQTSDQMAKKLTSPQQFALGGSSEDTVPALLTPGEFVINKKAAKRIGYSRLHQMNKADKIQGYNSGGIVGGIQKFFVGGIAEKDTQRAQGQILSSVEEGAAAFAQIMSQLPKQLSDIILAKFKGIEDVEAGQAISLIGGSPAFSEKTRGMAASSSKASAIGLQITGKKGGATTETVAHETGHLADFELGGGKGSFASETKGTFQFELISKVKKQMENAFKKAGKSAAEIEKYLGTGPELFAEFFAKASPEVRSIIASTTDAKVGMKALADHLGETGYTYAGLEASDLTPSKPKKPQQKDGFGFLKQQSKAIEAAKSEAVSFESLKPRTKTRKEAKQQLDDSGLKTLTSGIAKTSGEIAKLKAQTESLYKQSKSLDNQIGQYDQAILKIKSSTEEGAKGNKALNRLIQMKISAETQRLTVDKQAVAGEEQLIALNQQKAQQIAAAKTFKAGGVPKGESPDDTKREDISINPQIAAERQKYLQTKAEKAGMSVSGYKYSMAQKLGQNRFNIEREMTLAREETKSMAVGRSRELKGVDIAGSLKEGNTSQDAQRVQSIIADFTTKLQEANPALTFQEARDAAIDLATKLSEGKDSVEKIVASNNTLNESLNGTINANTVMGETFRRTSVEMGESVENLKANVSSKQLEQQAFIQSTEGQRFGKLAEFAPGLTKKISETKVGQGLGKAADFISGKGGKFSKGFAALGGFQGIGSGVAVGSEMLRTSGLIDKKTLKNSNVAGAFGAAQGAGSMAAAGAQLGSFAGPIGTVIGGIGGAIIGGIKGFFDAKNAQVLSNALDKVAKSSEGVDIAFKELAKNDTDANFKNVQKAFGQQIEASKELENIAFGGDGQGPSAMGVGGGAAAGALGGAAAGAWIGSIVPVLGTAIGAAVGAGIGGLVGGITSYLSEGQNKANKEEALRGRIGSAGAMNESAARMAERQMGKMSTEQLGQQEKAGVNIIAEQYKESAIAAAEAANGTKNLTAAQKEQVSQGAAETAYLDAYMKMRKEAGATDEKISEDIMADRKLALEAGKKALDAQSQAAQKQALLARATKEVALATENLLDVYRRVGAKAQRFSDEVDDMLGGTQATIASLGGNATVQKVDRSGSERILGNMAAYSSQEVKAATQEMVGKLGGGEEAQALGKQAEAAKFLQDKLPSMLRNENADPSQIMDQLRDEMRDMGIGGDAVDKMLGEIEKQIKDNEKGGLGTLADEISSGGIDKFSMTAAEAAKTLQNLSKTYNDTLQKSIDLQNQYNETIMQANTYLRKAGSIRITAELDLAKALGNSPTLAQLNEPIDFEIKDLTKGLVAGGTTDPAAIAAGIVAKTEQNQQLQAANTNLGNVGMQGAATGAGDAGAKLLAEQQKNIAAMGANSVAINEGRQALEKLANDGTKAANALAKIEEQQRQVEGLGNRFEKIFTAGPEELFKMNRQSAALEAAKVAGPEQFKSRAFRQDAFAGLEQDKEFLTGEEYRKQRGMLMRKSLEAQGYTGQSTIQKGGINMTVDEFIKRIEGGISEEDPNVKAYREAIDTQIKANEELARLEEMKSLQIQEAMLGLQVFLKNEFPKILIDAVKASREDSETKPETKSKGVETASAKVKEAQSATAQAQAELDEADKAVKGFKRRTTKGDKSAMAEKMRANDTAELEKLKATREEKRKNLEAKKGEQAKAEGELTQTKVAEKEAVKAAEQKDKEAKVTSSVEQSQRAREGVAPTLIPAPPAPGTPEAELASIREQKAQKQKRDEQIKTEQAAQERAKAEQTKAEEAKKTTQTTAATYGSTKPQVSTTITPEAKKKKEPEFIKGEDAITRAEKDYAPTPERKAFVQNELKEARKRQKMGQALPTDDSVISASIFELRNIEKTEKSKPNPRAEQYLAGKKARREAYLSRFRPEVREKMMTKEERAERDSQVAKAEEAKRQAEMQAQEQQASSFREEAAAHPRPSTLSSMAQEVSNAMSTETDAAYAMRYSNPGVRAAMSPEDRARAERGDTQNQLGLRRPHTQASISFGSALSTAEDLYATASQEAAYMQTAGLSGPTPTTQRMADQFRSSMAIQPINSNLPKPVEYTRQVQATETGTTTQTGAKPTETTAQLLTLDPKSLEGLNSFNNTFGSYVERLVNFQFPTIPEKIEMTGTHVVDVRVSGAAAFESLQKGVKDLINKSIDEKMSEIWKQTGGAVGTRPGAPSPKGK